MKLKREEDKPREKRGFEVISEHIMKCDSCYKKLLLITKVKDGERQTRTRAICPKCKDTTFFHSECGVIYVDSLDNRINNIITETPEKNVIEQTMELK